MTFKRDNLLQPSGTPMHKTERWFLLSSQGAVGTNANWVMRSRTNERISPVAQGIVKLAIYRYR